MTATQGFLANLTLDGTDYTDIVVSAPLARTKASLNKATQDGTGEMVSIPGMASGSLSISGFIDEPLHNALEATWKKDDAVTFKLTILAGLTSDAAWSGNVTLTGLTVEPQESGLWEFSLTADTSGPVTYAPSAP